VVQFAEVIHRQSVGHCEAKGRRNLTNDCLPSTRERAAVRQDDRLVAGRPALFPIILLTLALSGSRIDDGCGAERRSVKNLTDAEARGVRPEPKKTTIEELVSLSAPVFHEHGPRNEAEKTTYEVVADVVGFKLEEGDGDIVVIAGDSGATMIVEIPDPRCSAGSPVEKQIETARRTFIQQFGQPLRGVFRKLHNPVRARLVGVGFFDLLHGQRGVAPNAFELHPILSIERLDR
jgi:hypothetical protein